MALKGWFSGHSAERQTPPSSSNASPDAAVKHDYETKATYDVETTGQQGFLLRSRHPMNRIDKPRRGSIASLDPSESASVLKQLESEEGNSIQYRTCSWQKTAAVCVPDAG